MEWLITILLPLVSHGNDDLMLKIIKVESGFTNHQIRKEHHIGDTSVGAGQILEKTAASIGYDKHKMKPLAEPFINLYYSSKYLNMCFKAAKNARQAACFYNRGLRDLACTNIKNNVYVSKVFGEYKKKKRSMNKLFMPITII